MPESLLLLLQALPPLGRPPAAISGHPPRPVQGPAGSHFFKVGAFPATVQKPVHKFLKPALFWPILSTFLAVPGRIPPAGAQ